jgi:hypothetical protein
MWRKLLARTHPDAGGSHELFIWTGALREHVEECLNPSDRGHVGYTPEDRGRADPASDRVPFDGSLPFDEHTRAILTYGREADMAHGHVLALLIDCDDARHGRAFEQQYRGATYKQLAAIAHVVSMSYQQRQDFYKVAESLQLTQRHAGHILGRLKKAAA